MDRSLLAAPDVCQGNPDVPDRSIEDKKLVLAGFIRAAIESTDWKHVAVAEALHVDQPYLSRLLAGEKPLNLNHVLSLPRTVASHVARLNAEAHGWRCVPPVSDADAMHYLAIGLINLFQKAPAKATLESRRREGVA
jgi:hypothetical protein